MVSLRLIIGMVCAGVLLSMITAYLYFSLTVDMNTDTSKLYDAPPASAVPESLDEYHKQSGQEVRVSDEYTGPTVIYQQGIFLPGILTINPIADNPSCLVRIENRDAQQLIIRLGPFSEKDNRGFSYDPIPPGAWLVIDPRYGMTEEFFYNRARPDAIFRVVLDKKCFL
ncbi:MAG: hypothetical protein AAB972_03340, partial [Patescibacteria group bacterium]